MGTTTDHLPDMASLDYQEQVARIARSIEGARKSSAEQHKLSAEAAKLRVDRFFAPFIVLASLGSGLLVAILSHVWR